MDADSKTDIEPKNGHGRGPDGRFRPGGPGGPGRPKNVLNRTTVDLRDIRREIVSTFWEPGPGGEPAGLAAIRKLRDECPRTYLQLVVTLLPPPQVIDQPRGVRLLAMLARQRQQVDDDGHLQLPEAVHIEPIVTESSR